MNATLARIAQPTSPTVPVHRSVVIQVPKTENIEILTYLIETLVYLQQDYTNCKLLTFEIFSNPLNSRGT